MPLNEPDQGRHAGPPYPVGAADCGVAQKRQGALGNVDRNRHHIISDGWPRGLQLLTLI
jgi:hypothetical protein